MTALQLFLIGTPQSGKTTVFQALTNTPEGPRFSTKGMHHIGTVKVPDERVERLRDMYKPKKWTPTETTFVDVALPPAPEGTNPFSHHTAFLGDADAFVLVLQCFGSMDYRGKPVDPAAQLDSVVLELAVSDLEKVEHRLEKIAHERSRGLKNSESEQHLLERAKAHLEGEKPLRDMILSPEEEKSLRTFQFLSQKPVLVVANVAEDRLDGKDLDPLRDAAKRHGLDVLALCAPLEAEMAQLEPEAQEAFLKDYGLEESGRLRLIHAAYRLLDLVSFFTVGENEVRAWAIRRGTHAAEAAGKVHTDMERGFIRAETAACEDLFKAGSWAACRDNGTLRIEGKNYEVKDGDVLLIRFST